MQYSRWERRDTTTREELGFAALHWCRAVRAANPKVTDARYFWVDAGNTMVVLVEGQPGIADYIPDPDESLARATFALHDLARSVVTEVWTDAREGLRQYGIAGRPSGTSDDAACRVCQGTGELLSTDTGGGSASFACPACGGSGVRAE